MRILDLSKKQLLVLGGILTLVGVTTGEGPAAVAFIGGAIMAWALKPPTKVYAVVKYESKDVPVVEKVIPAEEMEEK